MLMGSNPNFNDPFGSIIKISHESPNTCKIMKMYLSCLGLVSYVHEFLIPSSSIDSTSSVNEKSLDLLFDKMYLSLFWCHM